MGQLKFVSPSNVLSLRVPRVGKGERAPAAKANTYRPGDIEPPLSLTPERLELIKSYAENLLRGAEGSPASQIAHRFAPRAQEAPSGDPRLAAHTPSTALASGIRRLTVVLIAVALLPNLTFAALWLGLIDPPWSKPVTLPLAESHTPSVVSAIVPPVLSAPDMLEATEGKEVTFPIALDGTDGVPPGSIIVIRGLPSGSTLSNGRPQGETEWDLKPDEIGDLHLTPTAAAGGESKLTIQLLAPNKRILADAATRLRIAPDPTANIAADAIEAEPAEVQVSDMPDQEPQATVMEESAGNADTGTSMSDLPPLPIRRPSPGTNDDGQANWIRPSAYVNLRQSPSSSAPVVSVIARGAKLRAIGRKRGWVQVTNPATSQGGWIYSGNTDTVR
jgi:Bacterial SH3 domain